MAVPVTAVTRFQQLNGRAVDLLLYGDTHTIERKVREVRELFLAWIIPSPCSLYNQSHDAVTLAFEENNMVWLYFLKSLLLRRHGLFWK